MICQCLCREPCRSQQLTKEGYIVDACNDGEEGFLLALDQRGGYDLAVIDHPTVKNVVFLSWLIQISSQPGELVFDGFMGTGSTALAAISTKRKYLGAEINPGYYETAARRIREMQ